MGKEHVLELFSLNELNVEWVSVLSPVILHVILGAIGESTRSD